MPASLVHLKYCDFEVCNRSTIGEGSRFVRTIFPGGYYCNGTRDEKSEINISEALAEGYSGNRDSLVWRSLVDHELLHSVVALVLFNRVSSVLATESGLETFPTWERYEEESIVLAVQIYINKGRINRPLLPHYNKLFDILAVKRECMSVIYDN